MFCQRGLPQLVRSLSCVSPHQGSSPTTAVIVGAWSVNSYINLYKWQLKVGVAHKSFWRWWWVINLLFKKKKKNFFILFPMLYANSRTLQTRCRNSGSYEEYVARVNELHSTITLSSELQTRLFDDHFVFNF